MIVIPYLKSQSDALVDIQRRTRDVDNSRWTTAEKYTAINQSLADWYKRVAVPHLYTIPGGWSSGTTEYTLPSYIRGAINPQERRYSSHWLYVSGISGEADTWVDVQGFTVEPNGSGGQVLRLDFTPAGDDGRIIWWDYNGSLPLVPPTLGGELAADATTVTLNELVDDIDPTGYIKIDNEWLHYAGVTHSATATTLQNLIRSINDTTAAVHDEDTAVDWGIGCHRNDLYIQLYDRCQEFLHGLYLTDGAESERSKHERQVLFYGQKADQYWRRYVPNRPTTIRLGRDGVGAISAGASYSNYIRAWGGRV